MNVNALLVDTLDSLLPTADCVYKGAATGGKSPGGSWRRASRARR